MKYLLILGLLILGSCKSYSTNNAYAEKNYMVIGKDFFYDLQKHDELMVIIEHEKCHWELEHTPPRTLKQEIEADLCSTKYYSKIVLIKFLTRMINKYPNMKHELIARIRALE